MEDIKTEFSFCLLILGDLGEAGHVSLNSIIGLNPSRICVIADASGKTWVLGNKNASLNNMICFHENHEINEKINSLNNFGKNKYVSFGSPKFFQLMILKWLLIIDVLSNHENKFALYSDLDVFWKKLPFETLEYLEASKFEAAVQDDFNDKSGRDFLCPGIMVWKNNDEAISVLKNIYQYQNDQIKININFPDDKALNQWLKDNNKYQIILKLPRRQYVIGHRFMHLMAGFSGYKVNNLVAFHANYVSGNKNKEIMLSAFQEKLTIFRKMKFIVWSLFLKIRTRIKLKNFGV